MKLAILLIFISFAQVAMAKMDGLYAGVRGGHVGLIDTAKTAYGDAIGYGMDFGIRPQPFLDLLCQFTQSIHPSGLRMTSAFVSADVRMIETGDVDFILSLGPGFYMSNRTGSSNTKFGIHGGFGGDIWIENVVRLGMEVRWHGVFSRDIADNYWTVMVRSGYLFNL